MQLSHHPSTETPEHWYVVKSSKWLLSNVFQTLQGRTCNVSVSNALYVLVVLWRLLVGVS